jgi:uncharacterized protein
MIVFTGSGGLRAGWRYAGFMVLVTGLAFFVQPLVVSPIATLLHVDQNTLNAGALLLGEAFVFVVVFAATAIAARLERRSILSYGLPAREAFRGKFWEGIAIGVVSAGLVAIAMYAMGGFVIAKFALRGQEWITLPLLWAAGMVLVGLAEESWFRGYPLQALARGTGFWRAAIISSLVFGALHVTKPDENFIDIFNIIALGMIMCFALQRTGSLWLPVGFHAAFDFMQFFVIGTRNGGARPVGTLLQASFPGPAWINGGPLGTEASYFMLPVMVMAFAYIYYRYPAKGRLSGTVASPRSSRSGL